MFSYIRWFSGISFILVVLGTFFVSHYFKVIASEDLIDIVENNTTSLVHGFVNTTWNKYCEAPDQPVNSDRIKTFADQLKTNADALQDCIKKADSDEQQVQACAEWVKTGKRQMQLGNAFYNQFRAAKIDVSLWGNYKGYKEMIESLDGFSHDVFKHFEDMSIAGASIYNTDGIRIISIDPSKISKFEGSSMFSATPPQIALDNKAFQKALTGETSSEIVENAIIHRPDGEDKKGVIIKTLIPIMNSKFVSIVAGSAGKSSVDAIVEVQYDVTNQWKQLDSFQYLLNIGVILIFATMILALLYTSSRAEAIIARQYETNMELASQAASAQAENRDKSQFLANVSHELRTPLNAIIGFSEFIKSERSGPIGNDKYAEYIKDIHGSGVHLLSLINDILDYSKAEADKLELEVGEVDATKSVKNSMRLVSPRAEIAQVKLIEEIPREHFILKTDAKKLKQVLLNLLSNAVKFTPAGGSVTVTMWQNVVDGSLFIEVKDTGIGIAPKDISRAMAPFGQVDNTLSRKYEGTGLGLPLTRKFVEIMGGTFNIQSEEGKGTVITVSLPREVKGKAARPEVEMPPEGQA